MCKITHVKVIKDGNILFKSNHYLLKWYYTYLLLNVQVTMQIYFLKLLICTNLSVHVK